ncbi:MAG: helix-turn-helix domain-containing protein [Actinobacteria bacterium]|nr:helix-turn-helix domain-containing protein [Actinomycetota bacterium]
MQARANKNSVNGSNKLQRHFITLWEVCGNGRPTSIKESLAHSPFVKTFFHRVPPSYLTTSRILRYTTLYKVKVTEITAFVNNRAKTTEGEEMATELTTERWITLKEAAAHLNVSRSWLYQKGAAAGVPRARIGTKYRYKVSDLDTWMNSQGQSE